jgi:general secretion pathway protein C
MRNPAIGASRIPETFVVAVATAAALALLACVLAYWTWTWLAPGVETRAQPAAAAPRIESAYELFGRSERAARAPTGVALTLLGLAAASGGKAGHAVLRVDGTKTVLVRQGEEIAPGVSLAEVHVDHVVLDHHGVRETLAWPAPVRNAATAVKKP